MQASRGVVSDPEEILGVDPIHRVMRRMPENRTLLMLGQAKWLTICLASDEVPGRYMPGPYAVHCGVDKELVTGSPVTAHGWKDSNPRELLWRQPCLPLHHTHMCS